LDTAHESQAAIRYALSVMLWTILPQAPLEKRLSTVARSGYKSVQLVDEFKGWDPNDFDRFRKQCSQLGLSVDAIVLEKPGLSVPDQTNVMEEGLRNLLDIAHELSCSSIIVLSGNKVPGMDANAQRSVCVDNLRRAGDIAGRHGVTVWIENINPEEEPTYFMQHASDGFEIVREAAHPHVKMLYDLFHEQMTAGNLMAKLNRYIDLIGCIHIADVPGRHEPGTGEVNYEKIFRLLGQLEYSRSVAMEFYPTGDPVVALRGARLLAETFSSTTSRKATP